MKINKIALAGLATAPWFSRNRLPPTYRCWPRSSVPGTPTRRVWTSSPWCQGDEAATERAVELGCYFSSTLRCSGGRKSCGISRPSGFSPKPTIPTATERRRRPGNVLAVEYAIARIRVIRPDEVRHLVWRNL